MSDDVQPPAPRGQFHQDGRVRGSDAPIPGKCGHKLKYSDPPRYCKAMPVKGSKFCRHCGGKRRKGIDHPSFKTGWHSKYLPKDKIRQDYNDRINDPELTELRSTIALLESREAELLRQLDDPAPWDVVNKVVTDLTRTWDNGDDPTELICRVKQLVNEGILSSRTRDRTWKQLQGVIAQKTRTVMAETKRLEQLEGTLSMDGVALLCVAMLEAAKECVSNRDELAKLQNKLLQLLPKEGS